MSILYPSIKESFLTGAVNLLTANVRIQLVSASYIVSTGHHFFSDVVGGGRVGSPRTLTGKVATDGAFGAAAVTFPGLTGSAIVGAVLYVDSGSESTSPLVCYLDTGNGLPISPDGGAVTWYFETGTTRIFAL